MMKRLLIGVKSYWNSGGRRSNRNLRVIMVMAGGLMNDVHDDRSTAIGQVE